MNKVVSITNNLRLIKMIIRHTVNFYTNKLEKQVPKKPQITETNSRKIENMKIF